MRRYELRYKAALDRTVATYDRVRRKDSGGKRKSGMSSVGFRFSMLGRGAGREGTASQTGLVPPQSVRATAEGAGRMMISSGRGRSILRMCWCAGGICRRDLFRTEGGGRRAEERRCGKKGGATSLVKSRLGW